jgi:N-acetylneuraminate synthase
MKNVFKIINRKIGNNHPPVIIAEIGINHSGSLEKAFNIANTAIKCGAEIIKHQTHIVDDEYSYHAKRVVPGNSKNNIYQIIKKNSLNEEDEFKLMKFINEKKKIFLSTPFSRKAVDRLIRFKVGGFKIGSGECNNYPLIDYISKFKKPIILSTGMNNIKSIKKSVNIIKKYKTKFALLHCTNLYPTPHKLVRLGAMVQMMKEFKNIPIGLSDHSVGINTCLGAIALGASIIEKHFTPDKKYKGPDISSSIDAKELRSLIKGSQEIYLARGGKKEPLDEEKKTINFAFASVVAIKDIKKEEKLTNKNIWVKRPFTGDFSTNDYFKILGKKAKKIIRSGEQLKKKDI